MKVENPVVGTVSEVDLVVYEIIIIIKIIKRIRVRYPF